MANVSRETGIDFIKAVSIVLVLIWHLQPITKNVLPPDSAAGIYGWPVMDFFYRYVSLLAVPSFICVSLLLFIKKSLISEGYWKKRLMRLVQLFLFWTGIQFIFYLLAGGSLPLPLNTIIPSGGPALPSGQASVFYFLFVLILCTVLATLFLKLTETVKWITSAGIIVLSCLHFTFSPVYGFSIDTMAMENYYIYIPLAYCIAKYERQFIRCRVFFIVGYLLAICYEEFAVGVSVSAYGRLSILLGVLSFLSICLPVKSTLHWSAAFLSRFSLGIFALHMYCSCIISKLAGIIITPGQILPPFMVLERLLIFTVTLIFTFLSVYLLDKTKMRAYIS
ncbi:MAG: acyltransferase family protein [Smithellaceae bacterium]|nr:acyltransferase family protein [Smithellaceae bacterium]